MILISYSFCAFAYLALVFFFLLNTRRKKPIQLLLILSSITLVWSLLTVAKLYNFPYVAFIWFFFDMLRLFCWLSFFAYLCWEFWVQKYEQEGWRRYIHIIFWVVAVVWSIIYAIAHNFIPDSQIFNLANLGMIVIAILGIWAIENVFRLEDPQNLYGLKYILLAGATSFIYALVFYSNAYLFKGYDPYLFAAGGIVATMIAPLILISAIRYRQWQTNIRVSRKVILHVTSLVFVGAYLTMMSLIGFYIDLFGSNWGPLFNIIFLVSAVLFLLIVLFSQTLRAYLKFIISRNFYAYQYDYREEWNRFIQNMSSEDGNLYFNIFKSLSQITGSTSGGVWVYHEQEKNYQLKLKYNLSKDLSFIDAKEPLLAYMKEREWIINMEEIAKSDNLRETTLIPDWLKNEEKSWLLVPLIHRGQIIGLCLLGKTPGPSTIDWETYALLKTISYQVASYLAEEAAQLHLFHNRQLEEFNKRFAFVVHDLKNVTNQLSLIMVNAQRFSDNPEFQKDLLKTVQNSVDKMKNMLGQLKNDPAQVHTEVHDNFLKVDLELHIKELVSSLSFGGRFIFEGFEQDKQSPISCYVQPESFSTALRHLLQNAIEASGSKNSDISTCEIIIRYIPEGPKLEIQDFGVGMSSSYIQEHLFKPLSTTKKSGYGIGAYQARELLRAQGMELNVKSEEEVGTTFSLSWQTT